MAGVGCSGDVSTSSVASKSEHRFFLGVDFLAEADRTDLVGLAFLDPGLLGLAFSGCGLLGLAFLDPGLLGLAFLGCALLRLALLDSGLLGIAEAAEVESLFGEARFKATLFGLILSAHFLGLRLEVDRPRGLALGIVKVAATVKGHEWLTASECRSPALLRGRGRRGVLVDEVPKLLTEVCHKASLGSIGLQGNLM